MRSARALPLFAAVSLAFAACSSGTPAPARLDGLALSAGALNPAFDPDVHAYSALVPAGTLNLTVTPAATAAHAAKITVSQDGAAAQTVASGAASAPLAVPARGAQSVVTLVASVGSETSTYTIQLVQMDDGDATLSGLALSAGTLNPAFSSAVTSYKVTVPSGTSGFKVTPTATQGDIKSITVSQDGGAAATVSSGAQSNALKLPAAGATSTVAVTVTAQDGYTTQTYTLTLTLSGNDDATLQSLTPSAGTLSPAFASATTEYTLAMATGALAVKLTPVANNSSVRAIILTQDGGAPAIVASGASSLSLSVPAVGSTSVVAIKVIAQDGVSTVTYTVQIRQNASTDAALSALTISAGTLSPSFAGGTASYSDVVPWGTASVTITPTAHAAVVHSIQVSQDGAAVGTIASGAGSPAITVPAVGVTSTVTVVVTAQDGVTQETYTIALSQKSGADDTLSALSISSATLSPSFDSGTVSYTAVATHGAASVTVTATPTSPLVHSVTILQDDVAQSGALTVPAVGGSSTIKVVVVSQDQAHTATYTVVLTQAASTVSTLSALAVSDGTLTFAPGTTAYDVTVPSNNAGFTVTPTAGDATETLQVGQDAATPVSIDSGATSSSFTIPPAGTPTVISVIVTAQSGATTTYAITVHRAFGTDATLSLLVVNGALLSPTFAPGTTGYTAVAPYGTATITLTPTANDASAQSITVSQDGGTAVPVTSGTVSGALSVPAAGAPASNIAVVVTAQDGHTTGTYAIALTQAAPDTNDALASLSPSIGALSPAFATGTLSYTLAVPFGTSTFKVTPTAEASDIQSITVAQDSGTPATVASGTESADLTVPAFGDHTTIAIVVTAQSGATRTYQIDATMAPANDSSLVSLVDSAGALTGFDPATVSYSYSVPYQTGTYTVTATPNDPSATLTVGGNAEAGGAPVAIALTPSATTDVSIVVTSADSTSSTTYTLHITEGAAPASTIDVTTGGNEVASGGAAVDFGSALTTAFNSVTFTIANTGSGVMSLTSAAVTDGASDYSITAAPAATVAPGDSTSMTVRFAPSASGTRPGAVTIANTSTNQPSFVIDLTGTGVAAVSSITVTSAGNATGLVGLNSTLQLSAAVSPAEAAQSVTWSSSAQNVATVDASGLVTATGNGSVTITATATDGTGVTGSITLVVSANYLSFVKQTPPTGTPTTTATISSGTIAINSAFSTSGNAFKYSTTSVSGCTGYYGTCSNGFVSLPYAVTGDFTMTATVSIVSTSKANSASGIAMGITTGFTPMDEYAYLFMPTSGGAGTARYVNNINNVTGTTPPAAPTVSFAIPTTANQQLSFRRIGGTYTLSFVNNSGTSQTFSSFTDTSNNYGAGAVYPCISFNNIKANITNFVIKDGAGNTLFDSSTGTVQPYVPASLALSSSSLTLIKGQGTNVTATAVMPGGGTANVSAVSSDPTVASVTVTNNASNSTIAVSALKVGTATVTVTNTADSNGATNTKTFAVNVEDFSTSDSAYGSIAPGLLYPAPGSTGAYTDGEYAITFDGAPSINAAGSLDIYTLDGTLADRIFFSSESQVVSGVTVNVGSQLARVSGNTVYFTPHFGKLAYSTSYYVAIPTTAISGATFNGGVAFTGFSNSSTQKTWNFTTRAAPTLTNTITVDGAQSSSADFRTLGGALMAIAADSAFTGVSSPTTVNVDVAAGTYIELVNYRGPSNINLTIDISGPTSTGRGADTVIKYTNGGLMNSSQNARASFYFAGANLILQNLTLQNTGVRAQVAQAEAMYFDSRGNFTMAANNCSFKSNQDTIQTSGKSWIYNSYIEGNTDFIWGIADATLIESCDLRVINDSAGQKYAIFVARTGTTLTAGVGGTVGKGYVLLNSTVSVDSGVSAYYGRDATAGAFYDQVTVLNNTFTGTVEPALWNTTVTPVKLGDSSYVGWKSTGNTESGAGLDVSPAGGTTTVAGLTSDASSEFTRDAILNRVVTVDTTLTPTGFQAAASPWDISALVAAWVH